MEPPQASWSGRCGCVKAGCVSYRTCDVCAVRIPPSSRLYQCTRNKSLMCIECAKTWYRPKLCKCALLYTCFGCRSAIPERNLDQVLSPREFTRHKRWLRRTARKRSLPPEMAALVKTKKLAKCPGCKVYIERDGGCPNMVCTLCCTSFRFDDPSGKIKRATRRASKWKNFWAW